MAVSRKGVFFSVMAIFVVVVMVLFLETTQLSVQNLRIPVTEDRIYSANDYVIVLRDTYIERVLRISSHRAIYALTQYTGATGSFINDLQGEFRNVLLYGEINQSGTLGIDDNWQPRPADSVFEAHNLLPETMDQGFWG
ncbi:MAG: hypothetical protein ABH879_03275 [archaeon]